MNSQIIDCYSENPETVNETNEANADPASEEENDLEYSMTHLDSFLQTLQKS
jgi:hypothetical protein